MFSSSWCICTSININVKLPPIPGSMTSRETVCQRPPYLPLLSFVFLWIRRLTWPGKRFPNSLMEFWFSQICCFFCCLLQHTCLHAQCCLCYNGMLVFFWNTLKNAEIISQQICVCTNNLFICILLAWLQLRKWKCDFRRSKCFRWHKQKLFSVTCIGDHATASCSN